MSTNMHDEEIPDPPDVVTMLRRTPALPVTMPANDDEVPDAPDVVALVQAHARKAVRRG